MNDSTPDPEGPAGPGAGHPPACDEVAAQAPILVEDALAGPKSDRLRSHADTCASCAAVLRRQATLSAWLRNPPPVPVVTLRPPRLPADRPEGLPARSLLPRDAVRRRRRRVALTAAGLAAAAVAVAATLLPSPVPASSVPVRIVHVRDIDGGAPLPDDDLLALTAGVETVALRRPTGWAPTDADTSVDRR